MDTKKHVSDGVGEREISSDEESLLPSLEGPSHAPIGINKQFISNAATILTVRDHVHKGTEDYSVSDPSGQEILFVRATPASLTNRRHFTTPSGEELFTLRSHKLNFPQSWYLETSSGQRVVELKGHVSMMLKPPAIDVSFTNVCDGKAIKLYVRGNWLKREAEINSEDGTILARVRQSFDSKARLLISQSTYQIQIAPGVDAALMVACVVACDAQVFMTA